jgi:hypothetical protein
MQSRLFAFAIFLTLAPGASSQTPGAPGAPGGGRGRGGGPQIKAVEVHSDHTVTFRFNAPTAKEIVLVANFLPEPLPLVKDEKGVFSATTKPLEPAIYHYHYSIDGVRGIDPNNPYGQRGAGDATGSMFEVHADTPAYFEECRRGAQFPRLYTPGLCFQQNKVSRPVSLARLRPE